MIIVTGANGFIGSFLVEELNKKSFSDIICVDPVDLNERTQPLASAKYSDFISEVQLLENLSNNTYENKITGIFHMGACSTTTEMDREYLRKNNTEYTKILFDYCKQKNIPFIYASSGAVYGDGQQGFSDQVSSEQYTSLNPYGESKLNFDLWVEKQETTNNKWYGLRFFNVYGPNEYHKESMSSLVFKATHQIKDTNRLKLFKSHNPDYKDGEQLRDFVYVKDITRWMIELYETQKATSGVYNLGFGEARSWLDLARSVFKNMNQDLNIDWIDIPESIRNQYQYYTKADISKLKSQGLSEPQWPLEKGIDDYLQNYLLKIVECPTTDRNDN